MFDQLFGTLAERPRVALVHVARHGSLSPGIPKNRESGRRMSADSQYGEADNLVYSYSLGAVIVLRLSRPPSRCGRCDVPSRPSPCLTHATLLSARSPVTILPSPVVAQNWLESD